MDGIPLPIFPNDSCAHAATASRAAAIEAARHETGAVSAERVTLEGRAR
jgi:hypothetical protein